MQLRGIGDDRREILRRIRVDLQRFRKRSPHEGSDLLNEAARIDLGSLGFSPRWPKERICLTKSAARRVLLLAMSSIAKWQSSPR